MDFLIAEPSFLQDRHKVVSEKPIIKIALKVFKILIKFNNGEKASEKLQTFFSLSTSLVSLHFRDLLF